MNKEDIISVSQLNQQAKRLLQTQLGMIWVRGEISGLSRPASGHWYFTLKDKSAQIRCAMFKGRNSLVRNIPKDGDEVIVRGGISLYEVRGDYQLIAEHIEAEGEGRLRQEYEALKEKLLAEGLFSNDTKQELPAFPKHIAIVSSATGAAVHDMCSVFQRRWPICQLSIFPCLVQGVDAAQEICQAIKNANTFDDKEHPIDAIIVGRGGGSLEDLQAFNDESVAREIFNSRLPIVSAVGHEVDFTISDFVADQRVPTPSAAAEILCPNQQDISQTFDFFERKLKNHIESYIQSQQMQVKHLKGSLWHPSEKIGFYQKSFAQHLRRLNQTIKIQLKNKSQELNLIYQNLNFQMPDIESRRVDLNDQFEQLTRAIQNHLTDKEDIFHTYSMRLNTVSPLSTLDRGYAIATNKKNQIIQDAKAFKQGDDIHITLAHGALEATIHTIKETNLIRQKTVSATSKTENK